MSPSNVAKMDGVWWIRCKEPEWWVPLEISQRFTHQPVSHNDMLFKLSGVLFGSPSVESYNLPRDTCSQPGCGQDVVYTIQCHGGPVFHEWRHASFEEFDHKGYPLPRK